MILRFIIIKDRCFFNELEWKERVFKKFCYGLDLYYCFLVEDRVFVKENCIERILILNGIFLNLKYNIGC